MPTDDSKNTVEGRLRDHPGEGAQASAAKKPHKRYRSRRARFLISVSRIALIVYVAMLLTLVVLEPRLVYPGAYFSEAMASRAVVDPDFETVEYVSTDDLVLRGRLLERSASDNIVLYFHGNGEKAKWMDDWGRRLSDALGATVMIAEYRGYEDDITPDEKGVLADCFAARDFLCQRYGCRPTDLILYGRSLGGGCAVAVAAQGGAKALVLERTFDSMVGLAASKYPFIPIRFLMRNRYDSIAKLTVYDGPLVMVHGTADELIPISHGRKLCDSAGCHPKHWIELNGLDHDRSLPQEVLREINQRVSEAIAGQEAKLLLGKN